MPGSTLLEALGASAVKADVNVRAAEPRMEELAKLTLHYKESGVQAATCNRASPLRYVTLDEMVGSRERLEAWFADTDKVLSYVRDTRKNAESYKASLAGRINTLMQRIKARQAEILDKHGGASTSLLPHARRGGTPERSPLSPRAAWRHP